MRTDAFINEKGIMGGKLDKNLKNKLLKLSCGSVRMRNIDQEKSEGSAAFEMQI